MLIDIQLKYEESKLRHLLSPSEGWSIGTGGPGQVNQENWENFPEKNIPGWVRQEELGGGEKQKDELSPSCV